MRVKKVQVRYLIQANSKIVEIEKWIARFYFVFCHGLAKTAIVSTEIC